VDEKKRLDEIAELARRQYPYGRPGEVRPVPVMRDALMMKEAKGEMERTASF